LYNFFVKEIQKRGYVYAVPVHTFVGADSCKRHQRIHILEINIFIKKRTATNKSMVLFVVFLVRSMLTRFAWPCTMGKSLGAGGGGLDSVGRRLSPSFGYSLQIASPEVFRSNCWNCWNTHQIIVRVCKFCIVSKSLTEHRINQKT
jgi:hypothetical protein